MSLCNTPSGVSVQRRFSTSPFVVVAVCVATALIVAAQPRLVAAQSVATEENAAAKTPKTAKSTEAAGDVQPADDAPQASPDTDSSAEENSSATEPSTAEEAAEEASRNELARRESLRKELARSETSAGEGEEQWVQFSFQDAEWPEVLRQFAHWAGLTLDMTDVPEGQFSYFDNRRHTPTEAIDILNGYLLPRGYALIRREQFLVVLKTDNELLSSLVPTIELAELGGRGSNELLRVVVPVKEITPSQAAEEVQGLLGPLGKATPMDSSGTVVLQSFGSNLRQAVELLEGVVPPATDDKLDFRSYPLEHLSAAEAEQQVRSLFGLESGTMNVSGARSDVERAMAFRQRMQRGGDDKDRKEANSPPIPLLAQVAMNMKVSATPRTNSLLVTATPAGLELVEEVLRTIDVPDDEAALRAQAANTRVLRVYNIEEADEEEVAKTLDVVMPGVVVNEDRRQETIHVLATPREHEEVASLIRTLDGSKPGTDATVEVIPIRRFDVFAMSDLLRNMFENERRDSRPVIQPEPQTRTLVVRGTEAQVEQIRGALRAYGEGDTEGTAGARSRIRTLTVGESRAKALVQAAQEVVAGSEGESGGIRIVVPGEPKHRKAERPRNPEDDDISRIVPGDRSDVDDRSANISIRGETGLSFDSARFARLVSADLEQAQESDPTELPEENGAPSAADEEADEAEHAASPSDVQSGNIPRVHVEMRGDQLLLYSSDIDALDEVEETMRRLAEQMPDRNEWTVFYLRAAEAEPTALRLYELLPEPAATEYGSSSYDYRRTSLGLSSPAGAAEETTLRIVPDARTNALFVSGTSEQTAQIEDLLELLDSVDLPESYRDRVPRPIPLRYARAADMAEVIQALYKDYLTDPAAQQRENDRRDDKRNRSKNRSQNNPRGGDQSQGVRLTLAIDEAANELLVACNEPLYREIRELVQQRDLAARDTERTVSVMRVGATMPAELDTILESVSSKITAEVTEDPSEQNNSRRDSNNNRRRD